MDVNLSGTAFSWEGGTIETFYQDGLNQSDYNYIQGVDSEYLGTLIEPHFDDSKLLQPFGLTWQATTPGEYYFFGIAEDFSGSESVTQSVKVTVSEKVSSLELFCTLTGPGAKPVRRGVWPGAIPSSPSEPIAKTIVASPEKISSFEETILTLITDIFKLF